MVLLNSMTFNPFRILVVVSLLVLAAAPSHASTPAWMCNLFGSYFPGCGPSQPSFAPTFEPNVIIQSPFGGATQPTNKYYFATLDTANKVCALLGCTRVYEANPCNEGGGPVNCSAPERICAFPTGDKNCGFLAGYWDRNPDNLYPGVALNLARADMLR